LGHGEGYKYAHDYQDHFVPQDYLGAVKRYYEPTEQGVEKKIKDRVEKWRAQAKAYRPPQPLDQSASTEERPKSKGIAEPEAE
jgi:putative ATPase